ncbi:MAG TPA: T9SS type A sorting domain-containing protein [Bacteroidia bacterium]|nr:T9SS type A sorting domain-containing protein [Bacteroidia bacterium]
MKKLYIIISFLLACSQVKSQSYYPMLDSISNIWYYTFNMIPVRAPQTAAPNCNYGFTTSTQANTLSTIGDTIINSLNYKIILQQEYNMPLGDCVYGYLREDTVSQKVYFMDNQFAPEELLYDFSMVPGDSILLNFYQTFGFYTSGYFHLDSISTMNIPAGSRRIFYLNNHMAPTWMPLEWIESVGHPGHQIYTHSGNMGGGLFSMLCYDNIDRTFYQQLTCFEHSAQKVYFDSCAHANAMNNSCFFYADSCYYWNLCGSVEEVGAISSFSISPNPIKFEGDVMIEANRESVVEVYIYSAEGRQLFQSRPLKIHPGTNKFPIQTYNYRHGMYVMELRFDKGSLFRKMVVIN